MRILIVKLSSLGDVVHAMPAAMDLQASLPGARIDWVVERGFAPLVRCCTAVQRVVECEIRRWRRAPLARATRAAWNAFRDELGRDAYDAVIDLQGLTKSALVARLAPLAPGGRRYALANRTAGSSYEAPTRWVADVAIPIAPRTPAVARSRELCARALGYAVPAALGYGLVPPAAVPPPREVALLHGSSRADKLWPLDHWIAFGRRLIDAGCSVGLPHGSDEERARGAAIAEALGARAFVWPRLDLAALAGRLAAGAGAVGVDSGLSHIAVALDLPHVQIYNHDTAWRTGPGGSARQLSVVAQPTPSVEAVWEAWRRVAAA